MVLDGTEAKSGAFFCQSPVKEGEGGVYRCVRGSVESEVNLKSIVYVSNCILHNIPRQGCVRVRCQGSTDKSRGHCKFTSNHRIIKGDYFLYHKGGVGGFLNYKLSTKKLNQELICALSFLSLFHATTLSAQSFLIKSRN